MQRSWLLAALLLAAPMAGCLGFGGEDTSDEDVDMKNRAQVTEDTGGIQGVVTDPAIQPIEGATITIQELSQSTETADDGSFAFSELPPGTYTLKLEAEGFLSTERDVDVTANEVQTTDIVLTNRPSLTPYSQQVEFKGFVECSVATPAVLVAVCAIPNSLLEFVVGENSTATNDKFLFTFPIEEDPWQMISEVQWDANQPLGESLSMSVEPDGLPNDGKTEFGGIRGNSPLLVNTDRERFAEVDTNTTAVCEEEKDPESSISASRDAYCNRAFIDEGGNVMVRLFVSNTDLTGQGVPTGGLAVQQDYDLVVTTFYHAPACEDYSLFLDNTCEQMTAPPEDDPADSV